MIRRLRSLSRGRTLPPYPVWLVGIVALLVATAAWLTIVGLYERSDRNRQAAVELARLNESVTAEATMPWKAVSEGRVSPETTAQFTAAQERTAAALATLRALKGDGHEARSVATAIEQLRIAAGNGLERAAAGTEPFPDMIALLTTTVVPAYTAAGDAIADAGVAYDAEADRSKRAAAIGAAASLAAPALIVGVLFWRAEGSRRRGAVLAAEQRAARAGEARFRALIQNATDIVAVVDANEVVHYISPSVEPILGYPPASLQGATMTAFVHPADLKVVRAEVSEPEPEDGRPVTVRVRHQNGDWRYLEISKRDLLADPHVGGVVLNARDITDRKGLESELSRQAFTDALTGLPNRALFTDRLDQAIAGAARRGRSVGMLMLDLDNFKVINDSLGHRAGDELLIEVGRRLSDTVRAGDTVARFGGDEFTILLGDLIDPADSTEVADRILAALHEPMLLEGRSIAISASIGIAIGDPNVTGADSLLHDADIAMYRAKATGKGCFRLFDEEMSAQAAQRLDRELDLRRAIDAGELCLHYQPVIDLRSGAVVAVEALVRWQHPAHGLVSPADFIPLAEETGLISPIGAWVLREACEQARTWQEMLDLPDLCINVNLSARQFADRNLAEQVAAVLADTGLPPATLCLEVTESAAMHDPEATIRTLEKVRTLGVRVAIDDFGTGYSALNYLQRFPVDTIKIDRSFVAEVAQGRGTAIVRAVTALAHALGMQVTAEGVETADQVRRLNSLACDWAQGYHFARPLTADAFITLIKTSTPRNRAADGPEALAG